MRLTVETVLITITINHLLRPTVAPTDQYEFGGIRQNILQSLYKLCKCFGKPLIFKTKTSS